MRKDIYRCLEAGGVPGTATSNKMMVMLINTVVRSPNRILVVASRAGLWLRDE